MKGKQMSEFSVADGWQRRIGKYWAGVKIELAMQSRRWEVWCIFIVIAFILAILLTLDFAHTPSTQRERYLADVSMAFSRTQIELSTWLLVVASGLLVADRIPRDRTLKMIEMNASTLPHTGSYIFGKYWGNLLVLGGAALLATMFAAIVPVISVGVPPSHLLRVFFGFWYVLAPVLMFVVAFNLLLSCIFSVRMTQILFPIIWLYSTYTPLGMATPANTLFAPDGRYELQLVYNGSSVIPLSPLEIGANLLLLLAMTVFCLFLASRLVFSQKHMAFASTTSRPRIRMPGFIKLKRVMPEHLQTRFALWAYHLRVSHPFLLFFLSGSFIIADLLLIPVVQSGVSYRISEFGNYVLETGVPLLAGILTSSTLMGDPVREMLICNRQGLRRIIVVRLFLSLALLAIFATTFLFWSLALGVRYTEREESLVQLFALWLIPTFLASTVGLLGAMFTRSSALGGAIVGFFLLLPHFARVIIMENPLLQLFTVPITLFDPQSTLWWQNRLTLLATGCILLLLGLWWMRKEQRLVESRP
jgi:hypothetical protein